MNDASLQAENISEERLMLNQCDDLLRDRECNENSISEKQISDEAVWKSTVFSNDRNNENLVDETESVTNGEKNVSNVGNLNDVPENLTDYLNQILSDKVSNIDAGKRCTSNRNTDNISSNVSCTETWKLKEKCNEAEVKDIVEDLKVIYLEPQSLKQVKKEVINEICDKQDIDDDTICGIGSFRPKWIQKWATARVYLALYSLIGILQGSHYSYFVGVLSTLEKRFAFSSKISGTILVTDEITPLFLGVFVGYFGGKYHKPRIVAIGMIFSALCSFFSALPFFIYGPAQHLTSSKVLNKTDQELCSDEVREQFCAVDERPPTLVALALLLLGTFLKGFGNLSYYAIGLSYMDDITKKKNTPIYFAVANTLRLLGPLTGYMMSSAFLKYSENPFDNPQYGPDDPRWIGGWWMGFTLQGILLTLFTFPLFLFPRRLPGHSRQQVNQNHNEQQNFLFMLKDLLVALKRLSKNPLFVLQVLCTIMAIYASFGHYIMLPKYMENQFRISASDASLYSGPPGLVATMISMIIGGYLIWKYRPKPETIIRGLIISDIIAAMGYLLGMIPQCQKIEMFNSGFRNGSLILEDKCNSNCNCSTTSFTPVCGSDGKTTYFSPCYAGCSVRVKDEKLYTNCSCVNGFSQIQSGIATKGYCEDKNCWSQTLYYIILWPVLQGIINMLSVTYTMIFFRSVNPEDKSLALGAYETLLSILAFIPYPIVFGSLVDLTCLIWEQSCEQTGNCWFYDVQKFNYLLHGSSAFFCVINGLCMCAFYFLRGRLSNLYEEEDDDWKKQNTELPNENTMDNATGL